MCIRIGDSMLELKNVSKVYHSKKSEDTTALENVSLKFPSHGMIFILGKSGSGKSTLLNILGGLDVPSTGSILFSHKDITKFSSNEYDSYRNSVIGFVFQDFLVLEEYNVYENVSLALELQGKNDEKKVLEILKKVDLDRYDKRKMNELSGGQKQRVAIARALVKDPKIILADEPTGNLDHDSGEHIFKILKEISQNELVIVVSHDEEAAKKYGDRIIKLAYGKVVEDTGSEVEEKPKEILLVKSKLPFRHMIKMAFRNLTIKPFKLVLTLIIMAIALVFFGITMNLFTFDDVSFVMQTMKENQAYQYDIYKYGGLNTVSLNEEDFKYLESLTEVPIHKAYRFDSALAMLSFSYGENEEVSNPFYVIQPQISYFIEIADSSLLENLWGRVPLENHEIVIHRYLADYILKYGVLDFSGNLYKPESYDALVNDEKLLKLGNLAVKIVGIVKDDREIYEESILNGEFTSPALQSYYLYEDYVPKGNEIYVKDFSYFETMKYSDQTILKNMYIANNTYITQEIDLFAKDGSIIGKNGVNALESLQKDEVVLSVDFLKKIDPVFSENYEKNLLNSDILVAYIEDYLQNEQIPTDWLLYSSLTNKKEFSLKVVGVSLNSISYISPLLLEDQENYTSKVSYVRVVQKDYEKMQNVFKNLSFVIHSDQKDYYVLDTPFDAITTVINIYFVLRYLILGLACVFLLFTLLLFINYITTSISYAKKEIGILRSLGTSERDVRKIFICESLLLSLGSYIIFLGGYIFTLFVINTYSSQFVFYKMPFLLNNPFVFAFVFLFALSITFLFSEIALQKMNKIHPIDVILNK